MFDVIHRGPHSIRTTVEKTVHEHRAPTDESLRILMELEAAALERVVARGDLGNLLKGTWTVIDNPSDMTRSAHCCFDLNGRKVRLKFPLPDPVGPVPSYAEAIRAAVLSAVSDALGCELVIKWPDLLQIRR